MKSNSLFMMLLLTLLAGCGGGGGGGAATPVTLVSIAVTPINSRIALGMTQQFTAIGTFSDNTTQDLTAAATWSSSAASVATISNSAGSNGKATSVAAGTTTITAVSGGRSAFTALTVSAATLVSIAVTPPNPSIVLGLVQQFSATGTFSDSTVLDLTASAVWSSSDLSI